MTDAAGAPGSGPGRRPTRRARVERASSAAAHGVGVDEMNCDELVERVTDYHEGALSRRDRRRWDQHVAVCIGCTAHLGAYDVTLRLVSSVSAEPLPGPLEASLLSIHRKWAAGVGT